MPFYKGARLKIKRADKHISDIEITLDGLKKRLVVTAHIEPDTGCEFIKCDFADIQDKDIFDDIPAMIGDAVHNLKCALDHAWIETMTRLVPAHSWERTKFPVHLTSHDLESALRDLEIHISTPSFFNFLMCDIKPYAGGDFAIRTLHKLDIRDKHRLLIPVVHYSSIDAIYLKDQQGIVHQGGTWGTDQPLPHYVNFERGVHIEQPGSASFDVMFEEGDVGRETRTVDTLRIYSRYILRIVELLEQFRES